MYDFEPTSVKLSLSVERVKQILDRKTKLFDQCELAKAHTATGRASLGQGREAGTCRPEQAQRGSGNLGESNRFRSDVSTKNLKQSGERKSGSTLGVSLR